ncbi:MAG: hypothetical protein ACRCUH_08360 [Shewanella sp.]|uniref:hypothetical protein n=1 Tax=Shewanella sp. TaxID=50422 RepID=UPI003F387B8A
MTKWHVITAGLKRIRLWHCLAAVFIGTILFLLINNDIGGEDTLDLSCYAELYSSPFVVDETLTFKKTLTLDIKLEGDDIKLAYHYGRGGKTLASIVYHGESLAFEAGTMTYKLQVDTASVKMDLLQVDLPGPIQDAVNKSRGVLVKDGVITFDMQIVDFDTINDFTLVKFKPSGSFWACRSNRAALIKEFAAVF